MSKYGPITTPGTAESPDSRFDHAVRAQHAEAVANVSPLVRSRLQSARHAASMNRSEKHGPAWAWAGTAAVLALALGAGLQFQNAPLSTPATTPLVATPAASADSTLVAFDTGDTEVSELLAALDENPDFYLWLAANDGALSTPTERYP